MDALNFAYWLNGFAELSGDTPPTAEQWKAIREHLGLVFQKVTPPVVHPGNPLPVPDPIDSHWWKRQPTSGGSPLSPLRAECVQGAQAQSYC